VAKISRNLQEIFRTWGSPTVILRGMKSAGAHRSGKRSSAASAAEVVPELPAWKAFVVQFSRDVGARPGIFAGRVEHLSSGRRARFNSADELLTLLEKLLGELGTRPR
jgi:hypothetical protein